MSGKLKNLPLSERPYEKLEALGENALSEAELLAIIIKTGTKNFSSVEVARQILSYNNKGIRNIHYLSLKELEKIKGIGRVKAIQIKALAELTNRLIKEKATDKISLNSPKSIANLYMQEMRYLDKEHTKVILLDNKLKLISDVDISIGTSNSSFARPKEIFTYALVNQASNIIIMHNHPSGDPEPSKNDIMITKRLVESGELIGISVLDHIIIGDGIFCSLKEKGLVFETSN